MLDRAVTLDDLRIPPANRLEILSGDRKGQHSVRIMTSGAFALYGAMQAPAGLKLWIITKEIRWIS
jgi:proteic killer suppression protein